MQPITALCQSLKEEQRRSPFWKELSSLFLSIGCRSEQAGELLKLSTLRAPPRRPKTLFLGLWLGPEHL